MNQISPAIAIDLRRHPRMAYSAPIRVSTGHIGNDERICTAVCHDLSCSGVRVLSTLPLTPREVTVQFESPSGEQVRRRARVVRFVHRNEWMWEYGLEFVVELTPDMLEVRSPE